MREKRKRKRKRERRREKDEGYDDDKDEVEEGGGKHHYVSREVSAKRSRRLELIEGKQRESRRSHFVKEEKGGNESGC